MQITINPAAERGQQFTLTAETDADRELVDAIHFYGLHTAIRQATHRLPNPDGAGYVTTGITLLVDQHHPQALETKSARQLLRAARELCSLGLAQDTLNRHVGTDAADPQAQDQFAAILEKLQLMLDVGARAIGKPERIRQEVNSTHCGLLCSGNASKDSAPATLKDFAAAFTAWEQQYRNDPSAFLTDAECRAAEVAEYGERCAIHFAALLRQVRTPA